MCNARLAGHRDISIHAPRMGSDRTFLFTGRTALNFNPRSPHGERLRAAGLNPILSAFQSTLPAWGATLHAHI